MSQHYDNSATINVQLISIHAPREGRDLHGLRLLLGRDISIHAPRAGRDLVYGLLANGFTEFQSTRPVRGATDQVHRGELAGSISIHAPRAGRDVALDQQQANDVLFQSTRPVRGATNFACKDCS